MTIKNEFEEINITFLSYITNITNWNSTNNSCVLPYLGGWMKPLQSYFVVREPDLLAQNSLMTN